MARELCPACRSSDDLPLCLTQDLEEEVPSYTWEQLADEAISLRPALWVNVNDIGRFFNQNALNFTQCSAGSIQLHNHWRWEPIPEVKKDKKGEEVALHSPPFYRPCV